MKKFTKMLTVIMSQALFLIMPPFSAYAKNLGASPNTGSSSEKLAFVIVCASACLAIVLLFVSKKIEKYNR